MSKKTDAGEARRKQAYEHILRSIWSAYGALIECCDEFDDAGLDEAKNSRDVNLILHWVHNTAGEIYRIYPDLAPPERDPPLRRWAKDPKKKGSSRDLSREQALHILRRHLELTRLILREAGPFADQLGIRLQGYEAHLETLGEIHAVAMDEIWRDLSDQQRRHWIRDWGLPADVPEPPPADRDEALGRLNEKLDTAAKVLNDVAGLVVELDMSSDGHLHAVGSALATIFGMQHQIYEERPDLIPAFLKGATELSKREAAERKKKTKSKR